MLNGQTSFFVCFIFHQAITLEEITNISKRLAGDYKHKQERLLHAKTNIIHIHNQDITTKKYLQESSASVQIGMHVPYLPVFCKLVMDVIFLCFFIDIGHKHNPSFHRWWGRGVVSKRLMMTTTQTYISEDRDHLIPQHQNLLRNLYQYLEREREHEYSN